MSLPAFGNCKVVVSGLKKQDHLGFFGGGFVCLGFFSFNTKNHTCLART